MSEAITIVLTNAGGWDGSTPVTLTRNDFAVEGGRVYKADIAAGGVIPSDLFGLFTKNSPKIVSVAVNSTSPLSLLAVGHLSGGPDRESVNITARFQRVLMGPEDVLRINTQTRAARLTMLINDLGEQDSFLYEKEEHRPVDRTRRYVITKTDGLALGHGSTAYSIDPAYDENLRFFLVNIQGDGCFQIRDFIDTESEGCYVWAYGLGFGAAGTMAMFQYDVRTNEFFSLQGGVAPVRWTDPRWFGYDDRFAFSSTDPTVGVNCRLVIEISPKRWRAL